MQFGTSRAGGVNHVIVVAEEAEGLRTCMEGDMKGYVKKGLLVLVGLLMAIQFVPVDRSNPAVGEEVQAPPEVMAVLERSCYDCHSNETDWPWYSHVAPVSWLLAGHVKEGREHANFSTWGSIEPGRLGHHAEEIREQLEEGDMPLKSYVLIHRNASLTEQDVATVVAWARSVEASAPPSERRRRGEGGEARERGERERGEER